MSAEPFIPETEELEKEASDLVQRASGFAVIRNSEHYVEAAETRKAFNSLKKKITDFFTPLKRKQDEAKRALLDAEKAQLAPVERAIGAIDQGILAYQREQERQRQEEERHLREIARKQEEERRLQEAIELEADGDTEAAEEALTAPVMAPIVRLAPAVPKVAGLSSRKTWEATVTNKLRFIHYVAEHPEMQHLLDVNMPNANAMARSMKDAGTIPGLSFDEKSSLASGRS